MSYIGKCSHTDVRNITRNKWTSVHVVIVKVNQEDMQLNKVARQDELQGTLIRT